MKKLRTMWQAFFVLGITLFSIGHSANETPKVLWVKINGTVELGLAPFVKRAVGYAEKNSIPQIVLEIETFGGRVDAAVAIRDSLLATKVKTLAWIHNRAISAGALIALSCDEIYFSPGSSMGAATPIQMDGESAKDAGKKFVSYFRGEMGSTAEAKGHNRKLAEAMVMADQDIPGVIKMGEVLMLNDKSALEQKLSKGTLASREAVLTTIGASETSVQELEENWAESIVRFLTDPVVSGLLMSLGVLGIILELQAPGFGLPGIVGATSLVLFFCGKFIVNLAGWEEVMLLILGIALIIVEIFVTTGTVIAGVLGFACILAALFFAGISSEVPLDLRLPEVASHLRGVSVAFILTTLGLVGLWIWITKNPSRAPLVLRAQLPKGDSQGKNSVIDLLVGSIGTATSDLRPSGKAAFGDRIFDVEADGEFLTRGSHIQVLRIEGIRILVKRIENI